MIIDTSDAASTHTLVSCETSKIPRHLALFTYASLGFSILPFVFALINVSLSPLHSIPSIIAYVFSTPFHVATILVAWQHARQVDPLLPFEPSSWRSIGYTCFLVLLWLYSTASCAIGSGLFHQLECQQQHSSCTMNRVLITFVVSAILAGFEVFIMSAIAIVCYRNRPGKELVPPPIPMTSRPKVISVWNQTKQYVLSKYFSIGYSQYLGNYILRPSDSQFTLGHLCSTSIFERGIMEQFIKFVVLFPGALDLRSAWQGGFKGRNS